MNLSRIFALAATSTATFFLVSAFGQNNSAAPRSSATRTLDLPTSTVRTSTVLVTLDVVVTQHGQPVQGLSKDGFHVYEDGKEQSVKVFEEHKAEEHKAMQEIAKRQPLPPLPPSTFSNYPELPVASAANILLLDALNTPLQDQIYVRKEMIDYLKKTPPESYMAVFTLGRRLRLVQGFTAQVGPLVASLQSHKQNPVASSLLPDPSDSSAQDLTSSAENLGASAAGIAALAQFQADTAVFQADLRIQNTLDALNDLAAYLGSIPGRKNLIWLSGSFPISFNPDQSLGNEFSVQREYSSQIQDTSGRLTASRVAVYPVDVRGILASPTLNASSSNAQYSGVTHPTTSILSSNGSAGRPGRGRATGMHTNPNSYPADQGKFLQQTADEHATMQQIAEETGGMPFYDSNDIQDAVARSIDNGENYYTIAYVPENKKFDGTFRKLRIELSDGKDYHLAYRQGYYATSKTATSIATFLTPEASMIQRGAPPSSQILFKVRVLREDDPALAGLKPQQEAGGFMKPKGPVKRYWIDFASDMHKVAFSAGDDGLRHGNLEVVTLAYDSDGKLLNVINRTFKLNLQPAQYAQILLTGLPVHEELDVPFGQVILRFAVHDLSSDRIGTTEIVLQNRK